MHTLSASIYAMVISIIVLAIFMITCLGLFYIKKKNAIFIFLIGTLGYLVPQVFIRYPLISMYQTSVLSTMNIVSVIFILSLTTALFETIGRYCVIKFGLKNEQNKISGILVGIGHGFCEALFLLVITYVNNLFVVYLSQLGADSTQVNLVLSAIDNVPLNIFYFTLLERVLYIAIQAALSNFMMIGILNKKKMTFIYVLILHFVIDLSITSISAYGIQIELLDLIIGILAILSIVYIWISNTQKVVIETNVQEIQTEPEEIIESIPEELDLKEEKKDKKKSSKKTTKLQKEEKEDKI